jgi:1,4-alpha-glucan branching enzyme
MVVAISSPVSSSSSSQAVTSPLQSAVLKAQPSGSFFTQEDIHLLKEGRHYRYYNKVGAHLAEKDGQRGVHFAVWAPNASQVAVLGQFNNWQNTSHRLRPVADSGYWETFVAGVKQGDHYKFNIQSAATYYEVDKADPLAFASELRPATASVVWDTNAYKWQDQAWLNKRSQQNAMAAPVSIYEVHLSSWMCVPEEDNRWLTYRELAHKLSAYCNELGFTHIELLPITEHPFDGSWGYQATGYFSPTSRFGTPDDFKYFVDVLHQNNIGVILDWVPAHFPKDRHGLDYFDGTNLYEHSDWRKREHKDWGTNVFNYGRWEVCNFLISSALFWLDKYHIDGLRVDAVASMLYLDYSRKDGEWCANEYGGRENIEAIHFLRRLNEEVYGQFPDTMTFAEESTDFGRVSRPTYDGGLGFGFKWDMGWMHDTLGFMAKDSIYRQYHQNDLTFRGLYMFAEHFTLPLSHDEVVHGKGSILGRMSGDLWQKFANVRLLYAYMFAQPGKKLLFMGDEIAQWDEWNSAGSLDWHLLEHASHNGVKALVSDLNRLYKQEPALHEKDCDPSGYHMIDCNDHQRNVLAFARFGLNRNEPVICVFNFTPTPHHHYRIGVPAAGYYTELLNSDATLYEGSGMGNMGGVQAQSGHVHSFDHFIELTLPPLSCMFFKLKK